MIRPIRRLRRVRRLALSRETGALTLSYVLIVPVFLIGIMTIVQASVWYLARETALAAARHGADVARTKQGSGAQAAIDFANSATPGFITHVSASTQGSSPAMVKITVTGQIASFVPNLKIHITEVVTAPVERFVALGDQVVVYAPGPAGLPSWLVRS